MTQLKEWAKANATLLYFLVAQVIAIVGGAAWVLVYMVNLEARVAILETRGSSHLQEINNRLTVTEKETEDNKRRLDKVTDIMTRKLNINP